MAAKSVKIEPGWYSVLEREFEQPYFTQIRKVLYTAKEEDKIIYPPGPLIFNAYDKTPFDQVKAVILGQDPYHNPGQAMGLSFSVPKGIKVPPSLRNIYKEIMTDVGGSMPSHGDLTSWAEQGVLLLNAMLTVEHKKPSSHSKIGWQEFTNATIRRLSEQSEHIVFMLWGRFAQNKAQLIDSDRHLILQAAHPSPLAGGVFFGCRHFSKANEYLIQHNKTPINWQIPIL